MRRVEIIKAAGQSWVVGLSWRSFSERPSLRERREDARSLGADWVALRETNDIAQAGFCAAVSGRKPRRLYALAAAIAEEYKQPWLGVFKLQDNLWWYIAVRDGQAILPDGDIVGDYQTILEVRNRHEAYADWNVHDGTLEDLLPLLEFAQKSHELAPVKAVEPPPAWTGLLPIALGLAVIIGGILLYTHHKHHVQKVAHEDLLAITRARARLLSPLAQTPTPDTWLAACKAMLAPQDVTENGWFANKLSCSGDVAVIHWQRLANATVMSMPQGDLSDDGNEVLQKKPLHYMPSGQASMVDYIKEDKKLFALLQPIGVQLSLSRATRFSGHMFFVQDVHFELPISPFNIDFDQVTGLRITSLAWTSTGWDIGGVIYGQ